MSKAVANDNVGATNTPNQAMASGEPIAPTVGTYYNILKSSCTSDASVEDLRLLERNRELERKYGSLYAADEEKARRKFQYLTQYEAHQAGVRDRGPKAEYLITRNRGWDDSTEQCEKEIAWCKARIVELETKKGTMDVAKSSLNEQLGPDAILWKKDKKDAKTWTGYLDLDTNALGL